jgi:hypothetical protein
MSLRVPNSLSPTTLQSLFLLLLSGSPTLVALIMLSEGVSLPSYFCEGCRKQFKPQGFANHQKKCKIRAAQHERDRDYESNLQALKERAHQSHLRSPKRCRSLQCAVLDNFHIY